MPRRLAMIREIEVSTTIQPYEDLDLVVNSVRSFFPDWDPDLPLRDDGFPSNNSHEIIHGFSSSLDLFLDAIRRSSRELEVQPRVPSAVWTKTRSLFASSAK